MSSVFHSLSFENLIANISGSLWFKDLNLRYAECNQDSLNLFGIPTKDFVLEKDDFFKTTGGKDYD